MSERYLITGVQLGMLKALPDNKVEKLVDSIVDEQFVGNSNRNIIDDVRTVSKVIEGKKWMKKKRKNLKN